MNDREYRNMVESVYNSLIAFQSEESARKDLPCMTDKEFRKVIESTLRRARQRIFKDESAGRVIDKCKEILGH